MKALGMALAGLLALVALYLIIGESTKLLPDHDEDQFIATGLLTAKTGALPYRDYPLFHTPYYIILMGWLSRATGEPFVVGRMFPAVCAWAMLLLLAWQSWRWLKEFPLTLRAAFVLSLSAMVLFAHVFYYTIGHAWNHQTPTLLVLIAVLLQLRAAERIQPRTLFCLSGVCIGIAIGMRLSFVPLLAPFGLATLLVSGWSQRERVQAALWFALGALGSMMPMFWLAALAPESAYFSNFTYPKLALMWRKYPTWKENIAHFVDPIRGYIGHGKDDFKGRPLAYKLSSFFTESLRPNWAFYTTWLLLGIVPPIVALWRSRGKNFPALLLLLVLPFLIWGSIAPSRVHPQYWYATFPLLVLCIAFGIAQSRARAGLVLAVVVVLTGFTVASTGRDYTPGLKMGGPNWAPNQTRQLTTSLHKVIGHGPVLTLEGTLTMMAGLDIYPAFAMGEFGWRSAHLLPQEKRRKMHLISPYDLDAAMAEQPPAAIFLRSDQADLNAPMIAWAQKNGFTAQEFAGAFEIWTPGAKP